MMEVEGGAAATGQAAGGFVELLPPNHTLYVQVGSLLLRLNHWGVQGCSG